MENNNWIIPNDINNYLNNDIINFYIKSGNESLKYSYEKLNRLKERFYTILNICIVILAALIGSFFIKISIYNYVWITFNGLTFIIIIFFILNQLRSWKMYHPGIAPKDELNSQIFNYVKEKYNNINICNLNKYSLYSIQYKIDDINNIYYLKSKKFELLLTIIQTTLIISFTTIILFYILPVGAVVC